MTLIGSPRDVCWWLVARRVMTAVACEVMVLPKVGDGV